MRNLLLVFAAFAVSFLAACETTTESQSGSKIKCPFHAPPEKEKNIMENARKINQGMSLEAVKLILGEPDETNQTYNSSEDMQSRKPSGFSYVYLIQRMKEFGTISERNEKLLRIYFDRDGKVTRTERIGFK